MAQMARVGGRRMTTALAEASPLRRADPRTKLALGLCTSLAVMLSLQKLVIFMVAYGLLLVWARLWRAALRQVWRMKWILGLLFVLDGLLIGLDLAVVVTLRLVLLAGAFVFLVQTTTPGELRLVLAWLRVPYRYAFSVSLAFQSLELMEEEWRGIQEAQQARGIRPTLRRSGWRHLVTQVRDFVALTVPAIVLTTKRAWSMTEAAYARGFDSPRRRAYGQLAMGRLDWLLLAVIVVVSLAVVLWR